MLRMIDCKALAAERKEQLKEYIERSGQHYCLMVIQVGDDPASNSYIRGKKKDCEEVGIVFIHKHFDCSVTTEEVLQEIYEANRSSFINGIIVQLPLPAHLDQKMITGAIYDSKDVDGFKLFSNYIPCTPKGVLEILDYIGCDVDGKLVCVIGRGSVGRPLVDLLTERNATVLWCNSHTSTEDLEGYVLTADVVISAAGQPNLITSVRQDQIVIDVGINRGEDGKLCGDVSKTCYRDDVQITPVPGGVGLMTRVALLENTVYGG